jgi:nitrate reductase NapE component
MIQQNFKSNKEYHIGSNKYKDIQNLNRDLSIVDGKFNIMMVYNKYLHYSIPLFLFCWIAFFIHMYFANNNNDNSLTEYITFSSIYLFLYVSIYTIVFSLILKRLTQIYADTFAYEYIMLMKELDIIIKENNDSNKYILDILKSYSHKEIESISDIIFTDSLINELSLIHKEKIRNKDFITNYNEYHFTLEHIDKLYVYNSKKTSEKINSKIDNVTNYLITYSFIILTPLYILSVALKESYIFIVLIVIIILIVSVFLYGLKKTLE